MEFRTRIYLQYRDIAGHLPAPDSNMRTWLRFVDAYLPTNRDADVLDIGCGAGEMLHAARLRGYRNVLGIDGSPQQVAEAQRRGLAVTLANVADYIPLLSSASLDAVVAYDLVEHFTRDEMLTLAGQIRRVLRPDGRWIIHTVNADSPFFGAIRYGDVTHEIAYSSQSISQMLRAAGFGRIECVEDRPLRKGITGWARALLWPLVSLPLRLVWAVETGCFRSILTRSFLVIAEP